MPDTFGYSDRINHAFAFAAKYYTNRSKRGSGVSFLTHPSNIAVILARYGCDEVTIVAGILHHVLEEAVPEERAELEKKIREKFGPVVSAIIGDVLEERYDSRGRERPWDVWKQEYLASITTAEPRALDICAADEIHRCGSWLADIRRLGVEYFSTFAATSGRQALWWYREVCDVLARHDEWPRRPMLEELRDLTAQLQREMEGAD
jgi:(p)ppGpp synthase/HD superfamily hydrolase